MNKIIFFTAEWCKACKSLEPHLKAAEIRGVEIERIDADRDQEAIRLYAVSGLPSMFFFTAGMLKNSTVGASEKTISLIQAFSGD